MPEAIVLPILGAGIAGRSKAVSAQKRQNLFLEVKPEKDKTNLAAYPTPGLTLFANAGKNPSRGLWWLQSLNLLYSVNANKLLEIDKDGVVTERGTLSTAEGTVSISDNAQQVIIVDGENGYIYEPKTLQLSYTYPANSVSNVYNRTGLTITVNGYVNAGIAGDTATITTDGGDVLSGAYTIVSATQGSWTFDVILPSLQTPILATALVIGSRYTVLTLGTSDFTLAGAASNVLGAVFTATKATFGTGTVVPATIDVNVPATALVNGQKYIILIVGDTDFTLYGAATNTVGLEFTAALPIIDAVDLVTDSIYQILTLGTTDFTLYGAATNTVGTIFTATGVGVGTGTAYELPIGTGVTINNSSSGLLTYLQNGVVAVTETATNRHTNDNVDILKTAGPISSGEYTVNFPLTSATALVVGTQYVINSIGTSDFQLVGAQNNEVGTSFAATGTTVGTGTCTLANEWTFNVPTTTPAGAGGLEVINNFKQITAAGFPGGNTVTFLDGYFIVNSPNTRQFYLSQLYDGFSWNALSFASKEAYTDNLEAVAVDNSCLVLLGFISQEYWQDIGSYPFPLLRIPGSPTDMGVAARWSIARCNGELIYLGRARRGGLSVVTIQNYRPVTVSTPDLDFLFNEYVNPSDAIAFSYRQNGHEFYQISFQQQGVTWLYDATSQVWSTLLSGATTRHYANFGCQFDFHVITSDYRNGNLYILDPASYTDNGDLIARELITPHFFVNTSFNKLHIYRLRLDMEQGGGLNDGQGQNPQVMLQVSRDGGYTWGDEMWATCGAQGDFLSRAEWRRLGVSRNYVFKFRITDPIKTVLIGAAAYATQASK